MSRDYKNEFGQDEERFRSRSRRRYPADGGFLSDSDVTPSRQPRAPRTERSGLGAERESQRAVQGRSARPSGSSRAAAEGYGGSRGNIGYNTARAAAGRRIAADGNGTRAVGASRAAAGSPRASLNSQPARAAGGRVYPSSESKAGDVRGGQPRDTAFRRSAGAGTAGRKASLEAAAADPAGVENRKRRRWILAMIILEVVMLCGIWTARNIIKKYNMIQRPTNFDIGKVRNENLSAQKIESMKGYWTVALFGVDSRDDAVGKGNNADVIIICSINQDNGEIKLVSIFRDSYLNVDENGKYNKINQAYFTGGPDQAVKALNRNLDLQIDDFATFNWKAVADAINILGGVDVELSKAEFHYINAFITETVKATGVASVHLKKAGMNHLDGVQAVAYARLRKMDTDFARTERQRKIIDLSFQKLKQSDFSVVNNVMEVVFPQILSSITLGDVIPAAKNLTRYTIADTAGFPWARSDANMGKKGDCVIPQTLESNVIRLHQFLYGEEDYQPSDMVKKISAKISADTGMYNEGKPIDKVGTDGGYIPKTTEAPQATEATEKETEKETDQSSASETEESIIDGEYEWGLEMETDEYGNPLDPPENWDYGYPGGHPGTGPRPGQTLPSESSGNYPGSSRPGSGIVIPGGTASASDQVTGPGAAPTRPVTPTMPAAPAETYPGGAAYPGGSGGPGSVIIGPGQ